MKEAKERINHILALLQELNTRMDDYIKTDESKHVFTQKWFSLEDACKYKGVNHNTVKSVWWRQPNAGQPDTILNGRRYWNPETIEEWSNLGDQDLIKYVRRFGKEIPADAKSLIKDTCRNNGISVAD